MIKAYFDDSGTDAESPFVVWAGIIGGVERMDALEDAWRSVLADPLEGLKPPLAKFSLFDCKHSVGDFQTYKPAERDAVRYRFRRVIADAGVLPVAHVVRRSDYDEIVKGRLRKAWGGPATFTFAACLERCVHAAYDFAPTPVEAVFDKGQENAEVVKVITDTQKRCELMEISMSAEFGAVRDHPGLQAADTIATEYFWQSKRYDAEGWPAREAHFLSLRKFTSPISGIYLPDNLKALRQEWRGKNPVSARIRRHRKDG